MRILCLIVILCACSRVQCALPKEIERCRIDDDACNTAALAKAVKAYATTGSRALHLKPFDPLHVKELTLKKNPTSQVSVELHFRNLDIYGIQDVTVNRVQFRDPAVNENCVLVEFWTPILTLKGPYKVNGSVLILPIVGEGDMEINLSNTTLTLNSTCKPVEKSGHRHIQLIDSTLRIRAQHVKLNFGGLFQQNKELSDNMNEFINENWKEIFAEMEPSFGAGLGAVTQHHFNKVFSKFSLDELYI